MIIHIPFRYKTVDLFHPERVSPDTPLVLLLTGGEDPGTVWEETRRLTERELCLAALPVADWENELSPWRSEKVFRGGRNFGDGADDTVRELEREIVPELNRALGFRGMPCIIAGYSLAGLFAVYALYRTDIFSGAVSASGSLWFPGFLDYAASHAMPRAPDRVYLSLGDREKNTKSPIMRRVVENTAAFRERFCAEGIECIFELNPGNHFQDVEQRIAKGIAWIVSDSAKRGSFSMRVRKHIFFSGRVQGVGFRYTATHLARPLDLTGWVKNLWDGRVEMEVQGRPEAIERLLSQLRNQRFIMIEDLEIQEIPVVEETGFVTKGY